ADGRLEAEAVELPVGPAERGIVGDVAGNLCVGKRKAELAGALVEQKFRDDLAQHEPVDAHGARLIAADGTAELARELLQAIVVEHAELIDGELGAADLGHRGTAEAAENVADSPDREADDQKAEDGGQDDLAEPVGRGFAEPSKHALSGLKKAPATAGQGQTPSYEGGPRAATLGARGVVPAQAGTQ